jgi:hypothetical protein
MHRKMFTHAQAVSDFGWATHSTSTPDTAADTYRVTACSSAAAQSAASPDTTPDAYRIATADAGTSPVASKR